MIDWVVIVLVTIAAILIILIAHEQWKKIQWQKMWDACDHPLHLDYYDDLRQQALDDQIE